MMAVMVEETVELKLSHHLHGDMGESAEKNSIDYQLTIITINYIYQLLDIIKLINMFGLNNFKKLSNLVLAKKLIFKIIRN